MQFLFLFCLVQSFILIYISHRQDQLAAHQLYGQSGGNNEPPIDQNMHSRNYYTRQGHAQAMGQQQQAQSSVSSGKELPPAHQASMPQSQVSPRSSSVYQPAGYTSVTPQVSVKIYSVQSANNLPVIILVLCIYKLFINFSNALPAPFTTLIPILQKSYRLRCSCNNRTNTPFTQM